MESRSHALIVGFFVIACIVGIGLIFQWLQGDKIPQTTYYIVTDSAVSGLSQSSEVRLRGLAIGKISSFHFDPANQKQVLIKVLVNSNVPITTGTYAKTVYQGITGQAAIELDEDEGVFPPLIANNGEIPRIPMRPSVIENITEYAKILFQDTQVVLRQIEKMLNDQNLQAFSEILRNTESATAKIPPFIESLETTNLAAQSSLQGVNQMVQGADQVIKTDAVEMLKSIQSLAEEAKNVVQSIDDQTGGLTEDVRSDLIPRLNRTLQELEQTSYRIDRLADGLTDDPSVIIRGVQSRPGPGEQGFVSGETP